MDFVLLWLTLGLGVLMTCGLEEAIASVGLEHDAETSDRAQAVFGAFCLTLLVFTWPIVLAEFLKRR